MDVAICYGLISGLFFFFNQNRPNKMKKFAILFFAILSFFMTQGQNNSGDSQFVADFKPMMIDSSVRLSWKMREEVDVMVLERRGPQGGFEFLDVVYPKYNQVDNNLYRYLDAAPLQGINHYRFKISNENEDDERFSQLASIGQDFFLKDISIIPNGPLKQANVHVRSEGTTKFSVLSSTGEAIKQYELSFVSPTQHLIDLEQLEPGKYYIQVNKNKKKFIKRITIK